MADLYLTPAEKYTAALGGFYYGDLPEPGTVYTQLIKDILDGSTPDKEPKNVLARFIYSLYISDLGDPYPRYELAKLLYWKLHNITPTKSGSVLTVTIDGKEDYMTINTDLSRLWYKVLFGSKTDVTTEFPYTFNTMQTKLSDWELFGNTVQSGTPSPDSPVMPQGTGERTGNLFSVEFSQFDNVGGIGDIYKYFYIPEDFTLTLIAKDTHTVPSSTYLGITKDGGQSQGGYTWAIEQRKNITRGDTFTVKSEERSYHYVSMYNKTSNTFNWILEHYYIMLNLGSEALPYEPYGYKIPISSAGQTTPIHLGEVESTRQIEKIKLDELSWTYISTASYSGFYIYDYTTDLLEAAGGYCNKLVVYTGTFTSAPNNSITIFESSGRQRLFIRYDDAQGDTTELMDMLNGAVFYGVKTTSTTGIVNEPLMKIGDYADSISMPKTGIDIPTVIGQNTLDVLTTVKPSSMRIEYTSADENKSRSKRISLLKRPLAKSIKA